MKNWGSIGAAVIACVPWLVIRALGFPTNHLWSALLPGLSIFGASWILCSAAEAAEIDIPQNIAIGLVALIAVLPEYAVDIYFAWAAGKNPVYTAYAAANMTGANRLLIGIGWPAVLLASWYRKGAREVRLTSKNSIELVTLFAATLYSFGLSLRGALYPFDSIIFLSMFCFYAYLSSTAENEEPEIEGPAKALARLPQNTRRAVIAALFIFSTITVYVSAAPFGEGLLALGRRFGIEEFLLVQWLAPIASEAPEFIVAILFALKGKASVGLRTLISSKVNQWTLLVGTLPIAYSISGGRLSGMPLDTRQIEELFLTSSQSLLGLVIMMDLRFGIKEGVLLAGLFIAQVAFSAPFTRYLFAAAYLILSAILLFRQGRRASIAARFSEALRS